jgi:hypothetical protein
MMTHLSCCFLIYFIAGAILVITGSVIRVHEIHGDFSSNRLDEMGTVCLKSGTVLILITCMMCTAIYTSSAKEEYHEDTDEWPGHENL